MTKSFLISIKPEYVEKILNDEKTLEIRTRIPKEWKDYFNGKSSKPAPSEWYIYCTKGKALYRAPESNEYLEYYSFEHWNNKDIKINSKVVAKFTLNEIDKIEICDPYIFRNNKQEDWKYFEKHACLTSEQMMEYIGYGEDHDGWDKKYDIGYALHIDNLVVYADPKELSDFKKENKCYYASYEQGCCFETCTFFDLKHCDGKYSKITVAPQSWCYVEE